MEDVQVTLKTLDNMPRVLFWRADEFAVMMLPFFIGIAVGSLIVMFSGLLAKYGYSKLLKNYSRRTFQALVYWCMPTVLIQRSGRLKSLPPSHIREVKL